MNNNEKISVGLKITSINPVHVRFMLYSSLIEPDFAHEDITRAALGPEQVLRANEFAAFVLRLRPQIITLRVEEAPLEKYVTDFATLRRHYTAQPARGEWDFDKWVYTSL